MQSSANHVRYEALFRLRMGTEARGELNRRPEEIHMVLDGLSRRGADPDLDRNSPFLLLGIAPVRYGFEWRNGPQPPPTGNLP